MADDMPVDGTKLNLGCGDDILDGYVNLDVVARPGVDVVHSMNDLPWPLPDSQFDEVRCIDILEHLPDTLGVMSEMWRVCKPGARVFLRVPHWNSKWAWLDPQHIKAFAGETFHFFDPRSHYCQKRPYYSKARFEVQEIVYECTLLRLGWGFEKRVMGLNHSRLIHLLSKFCDTVHFLRVTLKAVKE
ncbi:MAG: methyltransferase domain-containing protein [bacterium]|nr:methyltransferase domain-containing protein [bacterium]